MATMATMATGTFEGSQVHRRGSALKDNAEAWKKMTIDQSTNGSLLVWVGGLDSWNPLMKGIVTWVYP